MLHFYWKGYEHTSKINDICSLYVFEDDRPPQLSQSSLSSDTHGMTRKSSVKSEGPKLMAISELSRLFQDPYFRIQ